MLTLETLDRQHVLFVFRKFMEEYGLQAGAEVLGDLANEFDTKADYWGIDYGKEVQNAN